jgi:hypothetical protein
MRLEASAHAAHEVGVVLRVAPQRRLLMVALAAAKAVVQETLVTMVDNIQSQQQGQAPRLTDSNAPAQ